MIALWIDIPAPSHALLQALHAFPKAELDDPYHERTRFAGPPRRFLPGGLAWETPQEAASATAVPAAEQKLLRVAVVGVPNAGKSSMVNALAGSKVRQEQSPGWMQMQLCGDSAPPCRLISGLVPVLPCTSLMQDVSHALLCIQGRGMGGITGTDWDRTPHCPACRMSHMCLSTPCQVAAVSSKTNTTTMSALGAFTEGAAQVALFDTPGVVASG